MQYRLRTLLIALAFVPPLVGAFAAWNQMISSNCGGNNAAMSSIELYLMVVQNAAWESPDGQFSVTEADSAQRGSLTTVANNGWIGNAQFLVSAEPVTGPRRLLIVCDRPFTNVPRYIYGRAPPAHAAGYSDGTTALISAHKYVSLDKSTLIALNEILAWTP